MSMQPFRFRARRDRAGHARFLLPLAAAFLVAPLFPTHLVAQASTDPASAETSASSEAQGRILGVVLSTEGLVPVPGVTVAVEGRDRSATTDARGAFALGRLAAGGEVVLTVTRLGFSPATERVRLADGEVVRVEIRMEPRAVALPALAVLFERTRMLGDPALATGIPGSAFVLGSAELAASRGAFDNVHDVLRQVPGVTIQDEEGYGLRPNIGLRGAGAERSGNITLMEDGVLIAPAPYAAPAAYYFPALGRMEGIEVRKGASQVRYGPRTLGGAVNLVSAGIPDRRSWKVELGGGEDATVRAHARVGDRSGRFGWMVEGLELRTDGFKRIESGEDAGFRTRDFLGRFGVTSAPEAARHQELELKVGYNEHTSNETYLGITEADFRSTPNLRYAGSAVDLMDTKHQQLQLRYFLRPTASTDLVVTAYRNAFDRNWYKLASVNGSGISGILENPEANADAMAILRGGASDDDALTVRANNRSYLSRGVQAVAGARFGSEALRHNVEVGIRLHADEEDRFQWDDGYRMTPGGMVRTSAGVPGSQANRLGEARAVALFAQDEIRAGRLALVPGVRFETIRFTRTDWAGSDGDRTGQAQRRENDVSALIPGVGATWEWTPRTHLFAGVHRGFGPPGPGANEETEVESSLNLEAGIRVRRAAVGVNLTGFLADYDNILGRATLATGESGSGELFNGGAARVFGLETALDAELGRVLGLPVQVPARLAWSWTRGTFETDFNSSFGPWGTVSKGDRLPYLPEHTLSGNLGVDDGTRTLTLSWNGASAMRTEAGTGPIEAGTGADRFVVFNLRADWKVPGQGTLYGGVQNLADRAYVVARRPAGARPGLPRTFFVGFRIEG
jgi:Fe(3+) dicitrate transport protein